MSEPSTQVEEGLRAEATKLASALGIPLPELRGKLLRPRVAQAGWRGGDPPPPALAAGALAIQMVHEASLYHDDIVDDCASRRGGPSAASRHGLVSALVQGDHLLTAAYRVAHCTGSLDFLGYFTRAVEQTVAGERAQGEAAGSWLDETRYREIVAAKSGALFGSAAVLPAILQGDPEPDGAWELGCRLGCFYQMVDDFLDLCPTAELGKPSRLDYAQEKWTWPLSESQADGFGLASEELDTLLFTDDRQGTSPMERSYRRLEAESEHLLRDWRAVFGSESEVREMMRDWLGLAWRTLRRERRRVGPPARAPLSGNPSLDPATAREQVRQEAAALGTSEAWPAYFARHSKSFQFSARLFPPAEGALVSGVYAYCRFTDDLVDEFQGSREALHLRLEGWRELTREAYYDGNSGVPLLDDVVGETARRGVPLLYIEELLEGVRMDLDPVSYANLEELRRYSYRVASVVGLWLTELFGSPSGWVLERAEAMGHAMQLTNILRDVGEDWRRGRLYLPTDRMAHHGVDERALSDAMAPGGALPSGWEALMEELIGVADRDYALAMEAVPALPLFFQRPVAVAGRVYQGIHQELRRNGYDNLQRRAWTSLPRKIVLGGRGLWELRRSRRSFAQRGEEAELAG